MFWWWLESKKELLVPRINNLRQQRQFYLVNIHLLEFFSQGLGYAQCLFTVNLVLGAENVTDYSIIPLYGVWDKFSISYNQDHLFPHSSLPDLKANLLHISYIYCTSYDYRALYMVRQGKILNYLSLLFKALSGRYFFADEGSLPHQNHIIVDPTHRRYTNKVTSW